MTVYQAHCNRCGNLGKPTTIKGRADDKAHQHSEATGHVTLVNKFPESVLK